MQAILRIPVQQAAVFIWLFVLQEGEQPSGRVPKSAAPLTAARRMPARSTRVTRKLVEASEESDSDPSSDSSSQSEGEARASAKTFQALDCMALSNETN